jgi:uncharacterized repeat protein (TIGR01451 family)
MIDPALFKARASLCALGLLLSFSGGAAAPPPGARLADPEAVPLTAKVRAPAERRLHAGLLRAHAAALAGAPAAASGLPPSLVDGNRLLVEIRHEVRGRGADALPGLQQLDAAIRHPGHRGLTEAWVPAARLVQLAALPGVQQVAPARLVRPLAGSALSQGLAAGGVGPWHAAGLDGSGVTIAVIDRFDDGDDAIAALQTAGDWPPVEQLTLVKLGGGAFGDSDSAHGNALLEVVFDLAPGADYIAYDVTSVGDWRSAIDQAVAAGADIIVSALAAPLDGIGDGSALAGSVAERVEAAATAGAIYINAAGNERQRHWGGSYAPSSNAAIHTWSGSNIRVNAIIDETGEPACVPDGSILRGDLFWDDWTAVDHDYDLLLLELIDTGFGSGWDPSPRAVSSNAQSGEPGQLPQESIVFVAASEDAVICPAGQGVYGWSITRIDAATPRNLQFFASHELEFQVAARSLVFPADSSAVLAVAAIGVGDSLQLEDSSEGPILAPGGGLPSGAEFPKPDLASFAGVDTLTFGGAGFGGTSAAAAHAAGMAALLKQRHPGFDRDQLATRLRAIAATGSNDLGDPGHDFQHGAGRLRFQSEAGLVVTGSPGTAETGTLLSPVAVELRDDENLAVLSGPAGAVTVALGNDPSGGAATLSGTLSVPLADGSAAFVDLSIDEPGFAYTLAFEVDSDAAGAASEPFNVVAGGPGVPSQLVFAVQPSDTVAGTAIAPVVTVEVQDSEGAVVATDNDTVVELVLVDDPGATGLTGAGPVTATNGIAQFPLLALDRAGSGYRLRAQTTSFGIVESESDPFAILPGAAARLSVIEPPLNVEVGATLPPVVVAITDMLGNPQSDDNASQVEVALFANPGGATLSGTLLRTVSGGVATFDDLSLDALGTGYRMVFRAAIGALEESLTIESFSLAGAQSTTRTAPAGLANRALVRGLRFTGTVSGIGNTSTWASDLRMDVEGPSGSTFAVGGFNNAAPVDWDFQGSASTADGTYTSSHELIFDSLLGAHSADAGTWSFDFRHDWTGSPDTMSWDQVTIDLLKDDLYEISASFAVGAAEAGVSLLDLVQTFTGAGLSVTVVTDPEGLAVEVTYDGDTTPPSAVGTYAVVATVTENGFFGSAEGVFEIVPVEVMVTLEDLIQTFTGEPLAVRVLTDPEDVAVAVTYDGESDAPVDVGTYAVVATVVQEGHVGSASGTFEIVAPDEVQITLHDLTQTYDGTPRVVSVTTDPPGIEVAVTYAGETEAPTAAGTYAVEATVTEPGFSGSASDELVVERAATVTLLDSSANPAPIGAALTLTAQVTGIDPGGSVAFQDGVDPIAGCEAVALTGAGATRSAECVTSGLPGGSRSLSAVYGGDGNHLESSGALSQEITPYATSLALDALETSSDRGAAAHFSATLTVPEGAIFDPTGTLTILAVQNGSELSCQVALTAAGSHGCAITFAAPAVGLYALSASFAPGDGNFSASATTEDGAHSVLRVADLAIAKLAEPALAQPGEMVGFLVTVENLGPDEAVAVRVVDMLPPDYLSPLWTCEGEAGASCPEAAGAGDIDALADLPLGGRLVYTIVGQIDAEAELPMVNEALVTTTADGFTRDPDTDNNAASAAVLSEAIFNDGFEAAPTP